MWVCAHSPVCLFGFLGEWEGSVGSVLSYRGTQHVFEFIRKNHGPSDHFLHQFDIVLHESNCLSDKKSLLFAVRFVC